MKDTLNDQEQIILNGFVDHLNSLYPGQVLLIQLFGSRARGDAQYNSDYDVLVVVKDKSKISRSDVYDYVLSVNLQYEADLSLRIYSENEFRLFKDLGVPFIKEVLSEGELLWKTV